MPYPRAKGVRHAEPQARAAFDIASFAAAHKPLVVQPRVFSIEDWIVKLFAWRPLQRRTLRGFLDVEFEVENARRLQILECLVHVSSTGPWVALPGKPQVDRDGNVRRKGNGKPDYVAVLKWSDAETREKFSGAAIKLLLACHPDALDPVEAAA